MILKIPFSRYLFPEIARENAHRRFLMKEIWQERGKLDLYEPHHRGAITAEYGSFITIFADILTDDFDHEVRHHRLFRNLVKTQLQYRLLSICIADIFTELTEETAGDDGDLILEAVDALQGVAGGNDRMKLTNTDAITTVHTPIWVDACLASTNANRLCRTYANTCRATGAVLFQNLYGVEIFAVTFVHRHQPK